MEVLGVVSTLWLGFLVNWLSALLALTANVFYVLGYTMLLKRHTAHNVVWGGAAGCFPALIGWTAVTGSLAWPPVVLFAVIFYWTPPHFWALAIRYRDDYASVDVPMLPVVASLRTTSIRILLYTVLLWGLTVLFAPVAGMGDHKPSGMGQLGRHRRRHTRTHAAQGRRNVGIGMIVL